MACLSPQYLVTQGPQTAVVTFSTEFVLLFAGEVAW